ncbi:hypothetical protein HK099_002823, partial [Clydaea vesicula]
NTEIPILTASVTGLEKAFKEIEEKKKSILKKSVKAVISLDDSGLFSVGEVYLHVELGKSVVESVKDGILSFFGNKKEEEEPVGEDVAHDKEAEAKEPEANKEKKDTTKEKLEKNSKVNETKSEPQVVIEKILLNVTITMETIKPLSDAQKSEIKERIHVMDVNDAKLRAREEGLNNLEALIYQIKYAIEDDDDVKAVTDEVTREELVTLVVFAQEWLDENYLAEVEKIKTEHEKLLKKWEPINLRKKEIQRRPETVEKLKKNLVLKKAIVEEHQKNQTDALKNKEDKKFLLLFPEEEFKTFFEFLNKTGIWLSEKMEEQSKKSLQEEPSFYSEEVLKKDSLLEKKFANFVKSKKWKKFETEEDLKKEKEEEEAKKKKEEEKIKKNEDEEEEKKFPQEEIENEDTKKEEEKNFESNEKTTTTEK